MSHTFHPFASREGFDLNVFERYSDFTIVCGSNIYRVHRAILCPQSGFFERLCQSNFKEAAERRVELHEDDSNMVRRMVEFLYTGNYTVDAESEVSSIKEDTEEKQQDNPLWPFDLHVKMYILGDKYVMRDLKRLALTNAKSFSIQD